MLFAYFTNKLFVFRSTDWAWRVALRELWQMVASRLFSLGLETVCLYLLVSLLHMDQMVAKLLVAVLVVVVNYLTGLLVFKRGRKEG